ncbi:transposase [Streptomyces sp. HD]|uniref:transposase n=1 Tax=Streptomyces sp. HD TaxID=3020892 RepID=UPI003FA7ED40
MDDDLWALIDPLLPRWPQKAPGPNPVDDRLCLQGILYVLCNDVSWRGLRACQTPRRRRRFLHRLSPCA